MKFTPDRWLLVALTVAVGVLFYLHFAKESPQPVRSTRIEWPSLDTADSRIDCLQRQMKGHESRYTNC